MIDLGDYGLRDNDSNNDMIPECIMARVTEVHRELLKVVTCHGECSARLKGSFYNSTQEAGDFPAVGDFVALKFNELGASQIVRVYPRRTKFSRPDYSGHLAGYVKTVLEQVVAANFDYVFIMASLNYDFNVNRILRYITVAWESGAIPVVLLTKADLIEDYSSQLKEVSSQAIGVEVYVVSAKTGEGIKDLSKFMLPGNTLVFLGSSGVGKSTLLNALAGEEIMNVNSVREDDSKGRHTTTHRQLIMLKSGTMIIDTPGMRELGMWDIREGFGEAFSDIEVLFGRCRFADCSHSGEPGCAVKEALETGALEPSRWRNYIRMKKEAGFTDDKAVSLKNKKEFHKKISRDSRARQKSERKY
jgi:ribosome biogenesis GTPase / thiamine phosphate phosphatase